MPRETKKNRRKTSIVIVVCSFLQGLGNGVVHGLVITWLGNFLGSFCASMDGEVAGRTHAISISGLLVVIVSSGTCKSEDPYDWKSP
jgi:hypothetical protein